MDYSTSVLIIEPNTDLLYPYKYLPRSYSITRISSVDHSEKPFSTLSPTLILVSASLGPTDQLCILDRVKRHVKKEFPSIIIVVDLQNPLSFIIGTSWAGHLAVIDSHISPQEFFSTLTRVI